jgi:hypothetical protein
LGCKECDQGVSLTHLGNRGRSARRNPQEEFERVEAGKSGLHNLEEADPPVAAVIVRGMLQGMGREMPCDLIAWRSPRASAGYSQVRVIDAAPDLPDGTYTITFEGYTVSTQKRGGWWRMEALV